MVIALFSWRLFWQGSWQWIDNHWAFIPGISDPVQAGLEMADLWDATHEAETQIETLAPEAQTDLPVGLVEGNGDEDDDRVKPYVPPPFLAVQSHIQVVLKKPEAEGGFLLKNASAAKAFFQASRRQVGSGRDIVSRQAALVATLSKEVRTAAGGGAS